MARDPDQSEEQLQRLRADVEQQRRLNTRRDAELEQLRRELRALGVRVPDLNPTGRTKLSPQARTAAMRASVAKARAAKPVGKGKRAVSDPDVAARLRAEAQQLADEADAIIDEEDSQS